MEHDGGWWMHTTAQMHPRFGSALLQSMQTSNPHKEHSQLRSVASVQAHVPRSRADEEQRTGM
jgi:hypothetical protein